MRRLVAVLRRLRAIFERDRLDRELAAELDSHLAMHVDDNVRAGMPRDEARRQALLKLGGVAQVEEQYRHVRGIPFIERLMRDVRFAARTLGAAPVFTSVAALTLGLGIGANAAIFSVLNAVLFQPLPVERPDELVMVNRGTGLPTFSYPVYRDVRDRNDVLSGLVAYRFSPMSLGGAGTPARIWGYLATGNYFETLGVGAMLGRTFTSDEDRAPGGHPVVVLSFGCWQRRFGADSRVVGRSVTINGDPYSVIGVMPASFRGTELLFTPEVWVPMAMQAQIESGNEWLERRQTHNIFVMGRLRDGVSAKQAEASLNAIATQLAREHPATDEGMHFTLSPPGLAGTFLRGPVIAFSSALLAIAGLVLLLACTNLTGLLLVRSTDRQRDTAIRLALGASRADLIRRSLVESALLSAAGAAAALLLTSWLTGILGGLRLPLDFPLSARVELDYRVPVFAFALAVFSTIVIGLLPALQGSRIEVVPALKEETAQLPSGWHLRDVIVGGQLALSTILLIASLLVIGSLRQATRVDVGFEPAGAVSVRVDLGLQGYDQPKAREFQRRVVEDIAALPGIESVGIANSLPLSVDLSTHGVFVEGKPEPRASAVPRVPYYQVSPGFFRTLRARLVAGRDFAVTDTPESPRVAIINQAFVAQLIGDDDPLGKRFKTGRNGSWIEIVGVVVDGKYQSLAEARMPAAFYPATQWYNPTTTVVARSSLAEGAALDLVRQTVRRLDPALSLFDEGPLADLLSVALFPMHVAGVLLGVFGALAIVLVSVGTYGLMSYGIAQRTREICIRLAMGASASHIVQLVLRRAVVVWIIGTAVGVGLTLATAPLLAPILLGMEPRNPVVIVLACAVLAFITAAACWLPTRHALVTDPVTLLRNR